MQGVIGRGQRRPSPSSAPATARVDTQTALVLPTLCRDGRWTQPGQTPQHQARAGDHPYRCDQDQEQCAVDDVILVGETLEQAAVREAREETSLDVKLRLLLGNYSDPARDARGHTVSAVYIAEAHGEPEAADDARHLQLFDPADMPPLAFDHTEIVRMAHERLAAKLDYSTIAFQFMGPEFTLTELQSVYEIILQEDIDKRNFRKWVLAMERIEETGGVQREGAHRPPRLYRVKDPDRVEIIK